MPRLTMTLLGTPHLSIDGITIKTPTSRAIPLFAYLALTQTPHSRETIANLLWSENNQAQGLASLRTTLWRIKSAGLDDWLIIDGDEIALNYEKVIDVDVLEFRAKIYKCATHGHPPSQVCLLCIPGLTDAVELYHGAFLDGLNLPKAQVFDEWRAQEGEDLQVRYINALERLSNGHRTLGDFNKAIQVSRLLLREDPYNENAQYNLLELLFITGQRAAAVNQFKRYRELLSRELDIQPSDELISLYKQILSKRDSTITFQKRGSPILLVADIENASAYWIHTGRKRSEFISTYQDIFRQTARRFGGYLLQKSDDKITLLFENGQPLHYAVTVHLKLRKANWGSIDPPNVRMVVCAASGEDGSNHDFSMDTQTAANLLSTCWGGQVIFTEQTSKMVTQPPGSRIRDLGFHTLKGVQAPVHIFELLHPHLPSIQHQSLDTSSSNLVNFPDLTPAFIGRVAELEQLARLTDTPDGRIISLVGPGGVGKTRLAVQFAAQVASRFPDGVYFISLASIQDPDFLPFILADTLKFSFYGTRNRLEQLCAYLHRMNALLVFDNFEQVRDEGSKFLAMLVGQTHYLKIIVTSRERLNLISEHPVDIYGMEVPDTVVVEHATSYSSIRLFHQNAKRISPWFDLEENIHDVIRICQIVNGLPLAIILASSWVRVYTCKQIAEEISKNLDFLTTSAPDLPLRQRSLRVVFDNSWRLLSETERNILQHLSIFPTAFSSTAAEKVCAAHMQLLVDFLDKSVLIFKNNRYEMLDTFRQYTHEMLQTNIEEFSTVKEKFISYYVAFCVEKSRSFNTDGQRQALEEMILEFENILTAMEWLIELQQWDLIDQVTLPVLTYYVMTGSFSRGREFFRHALEQLIKTNHSDNTLILASMQQLEAWMSIRVGFITDGLNGLSQSLESFRRINSPTHVMMGLMFLGDAYRLKGEPLVGREYIENAIKMGDEMVVSDTNFITALNANCHSIYGQILIDLGEFEQAVEHFQLSLDIHIRIGTRYGSLAPLRGLARIAYLRGEFTRSKNLFLQALDTATQISNTHNMAVIHNNLGSVYGDLASPNESHHHLVTAQKLCQETGDRRLMAVILNNLAYHQRRYLQHPAESIRTYHESIQIFADIGDLRGVAYSYYDVSKAYIIVGLFKEARDFCSRALQTAIIIDSIPLMLHALHGFVNLYANSGERERALRLCYLMENDPQINADTQKRVIVSRIELEAILSSETRNSARQWVVSKNLQDVIDQTLEMSQSGR